MTGSQPVIVIVEGYATGASVYEALGGTPTVVAFDAGNLAPVATGVRAQFPDATLVIAGDDDHATPGNPGRTRAEEAATAVRGIAVFPCFKNPEGRTDFNDLHLEQGLDAVRGQITTALEAAERRVTAKDVYTAVAAEAEVLAACASAALADTRTRETSCRREATAWRRLALFRKKLHELRR